MTVASRIAVHVHHMAPTDWIKAISVPSKLHLCPVLSEKIRQLDGPAIVGKKKCFGRDEEVKNFKVDKSCGFTDSERKNMGRHAESVPQASSRGRNSGKSNSVEQNPSLKISSEDKLF